MGLASFNLAFLFSLINACFYATHSLEEVVVLHAPDSVKFLSNEPIHSSYLGDIFSGVLAYTVRSNLEWQSLAVVTPWKRPEALVFLEILGFDNKIDLPLEGNKFLLENAGDLSGQYDLISFRTEERYFGKNPVLLHMDLGGELHDSKIAQPILLKAVPADPKKRLHLALEDRELGELVQESIFNITVPSDVKLLTELATIKEFLKALSSHKSELHNAIPDIYWLKIGGLDPIIKTYGIESFQFSEAIRLIRQMISEVERTMRNIYNDNVVVTVIKENATPMVFGHKGRRLLAASTTESPSSERNLNLASSWDPMFPATFTIMVFISLVMILAVLGISIAMWTMDPGRDSIIYRATSQRIKKD